jgi:hypothetical protein
MAESGSTAADTAAKNEPMASLEAALDAIGVEELASLATCLARNKAGMEQALEDLHSERDHLKEENAHLHNTIEFMMKELQKLNIGADNLVEPQLLEGPLDFVGRLWEKMRPRTASVQISEHVGEIRKPGAEEETPPHLLAERLNQLSLLLSQRLGGGAEQPLDDGLRAGDEASTAAATEMQKHIAKHGKELGRRLSGALSFLSQAAAGQNAASKKRTKGKRSKRTANLVGAEEKEDPRGEPSSAKEDPGEGTSQASTDAAKTDAKEENPRFLGSLLGYLLHPGQEAPVVGPSSSGPDSPGGGGPRSAGPPAPGSAGEAPAGSGEVNSEPSAVSSTAPATTAQTATKETSTEW